MGNISYTGVLDRRKDALQSEWVEHTGVISFSMPMLIGHAAASTK